MELPERSLELEFVYGYSGLVNGSPNLFYTHSGEIVYYTAAGESDQFANILAIIFISDQ